MKRFIPVLLSVCLLVGTLAVPASAAGSEHINTLDLLQYGSANGGGSNFVTLTPSNNRFSYALPYYCTPRYVEILYRPATTTPTTINAIVGGKSHALTIQPVGDYMFRAYGVLSMADDDITFEVGITGTCYFQVLSLKTSLNVDSFFDINGFLDIKTYDGNDRVLYYQPGQVDTNHTSWDSTFDQGANDVTVRLYTEDWVKYDFIDYQLSFYGGEVQTISAYHGAYVLPFESSVIEAYTTDGEKFYYITIRLNVTGLDRSSIDLPIVHLECSSGYYEYTAVGVKYMGGGVLYEDNFLSHWLEKISNGIANIIKALSDNDGSDDLQNDVDNAGDELDNIGDIMDSVTRPDIGGVDTDITDEIGSDVDPSFITTFFQSDYVASIFSIVAVLATAGYVLYGKR